MFYQSQFDVQALKMVLLSDWRALTVVAVLSDAESSPHHCGCSGVSEPTNEVGGNYELS